MSIFEYDDEIVEKPHFLDKVFFENVIEHAVHDAHAKIEKVQLKLGSAVGDNYCSTIYRVKLHYRLPGAKQGDVLSVIVKCIPNMESVDFLRALHVFQKERTTFYEVLPRMNIFLNSGERFGGRLYYSKKNPVNTLAFEDLGVSGFETASRESGLDLPHGRLVMQLLGQFHAISMHLAKKDPDILKHYDHGMLGPNSIKSDSFLFRFFGGNAVALLDLVSQWPDYAHIAKKLQKYVDNREEILRKLQDPIPGEIRVLNHGDLWVNNMLFKYDKKGAVEECIFIDYQMSVWCSPGIDLNYFFYTSLQLEVLQQHREELLKLYYHNLLQTLLELQYKNVPSYQQIVDEVHRRAGYGFFANYAIYPIISQDKESASDSNLDNLADDDFTAKKLKQMFQSKRLAKTMRYTLKEFDKMGVLD